MCEKEEKRPAPEVIIVLIKGILRNYEETLLVSRAAQKPEIAHLIRDSEDNRIKQGMCMFGIVSLLSAIRSMYIPKEHKEEISDSLFGLVKEFEGCFQTQPGRDILEDLEVTIAEIESS